MVSLHCACAEDNLVLVSILLEQGASVNAKNKYGKTPLHIASERGNRLLAELLFQRGANTRAASHRGLIPLDCAQDEDMVALLAQMMVRAGLSQFAKERLQFVNLPCEKVRQRIVKDIEKATGRRTPPPFFSNLLGKSKSIVNMIWSRECDSTLSSTSNVSDCSAESGISGIERNVRSSSTSAESVGTDTTTSSGFASVSECAMDAAPLQRRATTALTSEEFAAIKRKKYPRGRTVSDPQRSRCVRSQTSKARSKTLIRPVSCLSRSPLRSPKQVSFPSDVLLDVAITNDDFVEACHLIKSRKVDLNRFGANGLSPLHRAAIEGSCECLQLLLDQGANINIKDDRGWTPLHDAVFHGHVGCAMILIRKGADLDAETNKFQTPLVLARGNDVILVIGRALVAKEDGESCTELMQGEFEPIADPDRETCV